MLRPGLSLLLALCVGSLLPSPLGAHSRARSTARLPVPAQRGQQPGTGTAGLCSVRRHCCSFLALSLLLAALCLGCSLRRKGGRQRREEKACTRSAWPRPCCPAERSPLSDEVPGGQQQNSASIKSFLRELRRRCLRGDGLQGARSEKVWKDLDEEAALFSDGENSTC